MKVRELIKLLKQMPQDRDVVFESGDQDYGTFYCDVEEVYERTIEYCVHGDCVPVDRSGKWVTKDVVTIDGPNCE